MDRLRSELYQRGISYPIVFTAALGLERNGASPLLFSNCVGGLSQTPQTWLDCQVSDFGDGCITTTWDYVKGLFPLGFLESAFSYYKEILLWILQDEWHTALPQPPLAIEAGSDDLLYSHPCLHTAFFAHANKRPEAKALVIDGGDSLTYEDLKRSSFRAAHYLDSTGVGKGDSVVVAVSSPSARLAMAIALLSRGSIYIPVSPNQADRRIQEISELCHASLVFDNAKIKLVESFEETVVPVENDPDLLAYMIFTSGTTGKPKGIKITHRQAMTTVNAIIGMIEDSTPVALSIAAPDFDLSIFDYFGVLTMGGTIVVPSEIDRRDSQAIARMVKKYDVTLWNSVPQQLQMLIESAEDGQLSSLRHILVSGDKIPLELPRSASEVAKESKFFALGGATEASIWSNLFEPAQEIDHISDSPAWASVPYGHPLPRQRFEVRSISCGEPCPRWTIGELVIGGEGVGAGYVSGEPGFFEENETRFYRTGDLGRIRENGLIEILGRKDFQVKVGGHRIELSEIEMRAEEIEGVARAIAGIAKDGKLGLALLRTPISATFRMPKMEKKVEAKTPGASFLNKQAVIQLLLETLSLCSDGPSNIPSDYKPLIDVWEEWLQKNKVESGEAPTISSQRMRELANALYEIVYGFKPISMLNSYPELNYERQILASPDSATALDVLKERTMGADRIAVIDASEFLATRCSASPSLERIPGASVECLAETKAYDCIIAPFSLHRFPDRKQALSRVYGALRNKGVLVMAELSTLSPSALLSATVISKGSINPHSVTQGTNVIAEPKTWAEDAASMGFKAVSALRIGSAVFVMEFVKETHSEPDVLSHLKTCLPSSHIPTHMRFLDTLPLSRNGKVDRQKAIDRLPISCKRDSPKATSETEKRVESIWKEVLLVDESLSMEDSFFLLGGDSLGAAKAARLIHERLCRSFTLRDLLEGPTIQEIASFIDARNECNSDFEEGTL